MNKARKINFLLLRKEFRVDSSFKLFVVSISIGVVLGGVKYLLFLIPQKVVLPFYMFIGNFIMLLPLADLSYLQMNTSHKKMLTYFKNIPLQDVQNYYLYRKFIAFIILILFLFFPLSVSQLPYSLFVMSVLGFYVFITTSWQRIFKNEQKTKFLSGIIKYVLIFLMWIISRNPDSISQQIIQIPTYYFIPLILLFYLVTYINITKNYERQMVRGERSVRYTYFKDLHILYVLRSGIIAGLLSILMVSFLGFDQPLLNKIGFSFTVLTSCLTIYYALLRNDQGKIQLFYRPNQLYKIRWNKLFPILKFSVVYLVLAVILGIYTHNFLWYFLAYLMPTAVFFLIVLITRINIEKRENDKIISWKDIIKIISLSIFFVFIGNYLISYLI